MGKNGELFSATEAADYVERHLQDARFGNQNGPPPRNMPRPFLYLTPMS